MQVRSAAVRPAASVARRPVVAAAQPVAKAAVMPAAPAKAAPIKVQTDAGFGSDMLQHTLFALTNLGQIMNLGALSGLIKVLPKPALGIVNIGYGAFGLFKDWRGLKNEANTKKSDDVTRMAGGAAIVTGGIAILAGAAVAPWVPLVGAGVAAAGYLARSVGIWNDETRW
ncbi:hypothetical protein D3C72_571170 [compost metagenome]